AEAGVVGHQRIADRSRAGEQVEGCISRVHEPGIEDRDTKIAGLTSDTFEPGCNGGVDHAELARPGAQTHIDASLAEPRDHAVFDDDGFPCQVANAVEAD